MNCRTILSVIVFSFIALPAHGETFTYSVADLVALSQSLTEQYGLGSGDPISGAGGLVPLTLLELLPLMEYVYEMQIVTDDGMASFAGDDLADEWGESSFVAGDRGATLHFRGTEFGRLRDIRFSGQPLEAETLEIWLSWEGTDELKREIERFAVRHAFIADVSSVPGTDAKLAALARARGAVPDLVMLQSGGVQTLVETRALQPLDYLEFPHLLRQGRAAFSTDGHQWAMPFYFDTQVVFINRDIVRSLPEGELSLEEMGDAVRSLVGSDIHPMVWNVYSSNWFIPFQMAFGKESLLDPDGGITVEDSPTLDALRYLVRLERDGLLVPMERDAMDALFIDGRVGIMLSGSYAIPYLRSLGVSFGVRPFPVNEQTGLPVSPLLDFKGFAMTRQTRNPVLARRMLQHLSGRAVQLRFCAGLNKLPARWDLQESVARFSEYGEVLARTVENGTVIPPDRVYSVYKNIMWRMLRFALTGQMTPEDTLQAAQSLIDADR